MSTQLLTGIACVGPVHMCASIDIAITYSDIDFLN